MTSKKEQAHLADKAASPVDNRKLTSSPALDIETQAKLAQRLINPTTATPRGGHAYGPYFLEYCLMAEYDLVHKQKIPGVYVIPSALTPLLWHGIIFVRQGLYQDGVFRFQLFLPDVYPDADPPSVVFDPPAFHPVINGSTGELDVKRAFPKWRRHSHHVWHVLQYAAKVFTTVDTNDPVNEEAARLYDNDREFFKYKVTECIAKCKERLYEAPKSEDPHLFRFTPWDPFVHEEAKKKMLSSKSSGDYDDVGATNSRDQHFASGLSWISDDGLKPFAKFTSQQPS